MIQVQLKLRMTKAQEAECGRWIIHLASVWNWAVRKIELNAANKIYFSRLEFKSLLSRHGTKLGMPSHTLQRTLADAYEAWQRCFNKLSGKPRLKGLRNRLSSIGFPDVISAPRGKRIFLPLLGTVRFHYQDIPHGKIKCGRIVKRASGWYLCLFIDAAPGTINRIADGEVGIDPGFKNLLTTSDGEIIDHPRELEAAAKRLGHAQRSGSRKRTARTHEHIRNQRKDRNHKLSRRLVAENTLIVFSADHHSRIARKFGKSVASSGHAQLRSMLAYKSQLCGTQYIEVASKNSTKTCSACGLLSGPTGLKSLGVRQWRCTCGVLHDRDVNAAVNTLIAGVGLTLGTETSIPGEIIADKEVIELCEG